MTDNHSTTDMVSVEVAYALPERQKIISLKVPAGTTALQAVQQSNIQQFFPDLDVTAAKMGIFGQALGTKGLKVAGEHILEEGDRVEIYRPLISDPKEVRRRRAAKAQQHKAAEEGK